MDSELTLPLDVLLHITELLADDRNGTKSLQILSQTCKFMVPICRRHLFSSLRLTSSILFERLGDLLSKNPDIARYVRSLNYRMYYASISRDHELTTLNILKVRSPLKSIELSSPRANWNDYPESIRLSLLSLIELPTVTHLYIFNFGRFPATALSGCTNLMNLQFGYIELIFPDWEFDHVISRSKIPTPAFLNIGRGASGLLPILHAGGPIDFCHLKMVLFDVEFQSDIDKINKLIKLTRRLRYIEITIQHPLELAGLGESLAINASRTLTSLGLGIRNIDDHDDPLCGFSRELGFIAGNNVLEELRLDMWCYGASLYPVSHDSDLCSAFDSMLTDSGAFPVLRRVSVKFGWFLKHWSENEKDAVFEGLKENNFPRLVESEAVEFNFSVSNIRHA